MIGISRRAVRSVAAYDTTVALLVEVGPGIRVEAAGHDDVAIEVQTLGVVGVTGYRGHEHPLTRSSRGDAGAKGQGGARCVKGPAVG